MNKKGFLFSLFVITALTLIVIIFRTKVEFKSELRADIFKNRVEASNAFLEDMEKDMERSLYVASYRAFLAADEYVYHFQEYLDNATVQIPELIKNGTINGTLMNSTNSSSFEDWIGRINSLARKYHINLTFDNMDIIVKHTSPWIIQIDLYTDVAIQDYEQIIEWNYRLERHTTIDIRTASFNDPMYYLEGSKNYIENTEGEAPKKILTNSIKETPYFPFWYNDSGTIVVDNLKAHTIGQYYIASSRAPSFMMRLEGNFEPSPENGIESLVNSLNDTTGEIWLYAYDDGDEAGEDPCCLVDYQFFTDEECQSFGIYKLPKMNRVINMPDNFYLDGMHVFDYNLTAINRSAS
jgi:hypothetical protein